MEGAHSSSFVSILKSLRKIPAKKNQKGKWSYATGACSKKFKDSGVCKLMIIGIVEGVSESYDNLKVILDHFNFNFFGNDYCYNTYAFDMKIANIFLGL